MSAASKAFRITTNLFGLSCILIIAATILSLHLRLKQSESYAHQYIRSVIIEANGAPPQWEKIDREFSFNQLHIDDVETNTNVIHYELSKPIHPLFSMLENLIRPISQPTTIHGYKINLALNHQAAIQTTLLTAGLSILCVLFIAYIAGRSAAAAVRKQLDHDVAMLRKALKLLARKESLQSKESSLSSDYQALEPMFEEIEENLIGELKEAQNYAASLEQQAFHDPLTEFGNKIKFKRELAEKLKVSPTSHFGILAIVRATALNTINQQSGYGSGDDYIRLLVTILENTAAHYQQPSLYRLNSSDLALVLDLAPKKDYDKLGHQLENHCKDIARQLGLDEIAKIGITIYQGGDNISELLARCDNALSIARTQSGNSWHFSETEIEGAHQGRMKWRALVTQVIENSSVTLVKQPQMALADGVSVYSELQARFYDEKQRQISTTSMLAEAQSNDLLIRLDKTIIEHAMDHLHNTSSLREAYAINLSNSSILDTHFCIWLERQLLRDPAVTRHLVFEVSEHGLTADLDAGRRIIELIHRVGAKFTIEHFGTSILSLKSFRELNPDYVKLDAGHTADIAEDKRLQYFVRTLVDITHQMGIKVIAEAVETVEQKQLLEGLKVDIIQGYFVGKPSPVGKIEEDDISIDPDIEAELERHID